MPAQSTSSSAIIVSPVTAGILPSFGNLAFAASAGGLRC
jgi:hypothetical protein